MSNGKVKLAIIGCGGMSTGHLNSYLKIKEKEPAKFDFVAMCDPVAERAQKFADEAAKTQDSAPKIYADVDEMLKKRRSGRSGYMLKTLRSPRQRHSVPELWRQRHDREALWSNYKGQQIAHSGGREKR